ncbi:MAG: YggT family protein [Epsilonproteobacteria bacterium]|nr:MAG: YggT family protein [Campylobacterota bacterium]
MNAFTFAVVQLLHTLINVYIWIIIISALLSFIRPNPDNQLVRQILQAIYQVTEPVYDFIRRKMPFVVLSGIDLSPIIILLALQFLDTFMMRSFFG